MLKARKVMAVFCWLSILYILFMIYSFSAQTGEISSSVSAQVTDKILRVVKPDYVTQTKAQQNALFSFVHTIVRKSAHFTEYALLGAMCMCAALCHEWKMTARFSVAFLCGALCAMGDEYHQLHVSGRSGQFTDVLIDSSGVLFGILCICLIRIIVLYIWGRKHGLYDMVRGDYAPRHGKNATKMQR